MSSNPQLSKPVRRKSITIDSLARQHEPTPPKDVVYRFSNGREFKVPRNKNPYDSNQ